SSARLRQRNADRCGERWGGVSAEVPPAPHPQGPPEAAAPGGGDARDLPPAQGGRGGAPGPGGGPAGKPRQQPARPLVVTGGIAALAAAASGLAVLVTLTAICWITAPHRGIGTRPARV